MLLSVLFATLPGNVLTASADKGTITAGLNAALDPSIAGEAKNAGVMKQLWDKQVDPLRLASRRS